MPIWPELRLAVAIWPDSYLELAREDADPTDRGCRVGSGLAAEPGFEPGITDPKSAVLPLHHSAMPIKHSILGAIEPVAQIQEVPRAPNAEDTTPERCGRGEDPTLHEGRSKDRLVATGNLRCDRQKQLVDRAIGK